MEVGLPLGSAGLALRSIARFFSFVRAVTTTPAEVTWLLRGYFCTFQLAYSNYAFQCARAHRNFRKAFESSSTDVDRMYDEMQDVIERGSKALCGAHASSIQEYFKHTRRLCLAPRVGIHIMGDDDAIYNVSMLSGETSSIKFQKDYTVFDEVVHTGIPYLDNNLPKTARERDGYKHASLNWDEIKTNYKNSLNDSRLISRFRHNILRQRRRDTAWENCWQGQTPNRNAYKSHLNVPVTFRRHAETGGLDPTLVKVLNLTDQGRSILGFMIVDHPEPHYFDDHPTDYSENIDVNTMY